MLVVKRVSFDAAHLLPNYPGKCKNLHGHHWIVDIGYEGIVDPRTGMVADFSGLKGMVSPLLETLDHHFLNDVIENPTAENLVTYIRDWLLDKPLLEVAELVLVRVWETETSYAEWTRET